MTLTECPLSVTVVHCKLIPASISVKQLKVGEHPDGKPKHDYILKIHNFELSCRLDDADVRMHWDANLFGISDRPWSLPDGEYYVSII